ncbi:MAG: hypothetical protein ACJ8R9_24375 [Steroidobacteraceae bacterium]
MVDRAETIARELHPGVTRAEEPGHSRPVKTRRKVENGWRAFAEFMERRGLQDLAAHILQVVDLMPPVGTYRQRMAERMLAAIARERSPPDAMMGR